MMFEKQRGGGIDTSHSHFAKLSSSSVPVPVQFELRLSFKLPPHPPTRESRDTATSGLPRALEFGMEALFNQTRSTS